jgi:hypothetical protein
MAEPGPGVKGWDASLVIDCTPAQHDHLQELIKESLSSGDWESPRPELGEGIFLEGLPSWDFGVYMSQVNQTLIDDGSGTGTLERACVVGGKKSAEKARESKPRDPNHLMKGTGVLAENDLEQRCSEGGSADAKPETKKAKNYHPNPENEGGFNSKWEERGQRQSLQRQQALAQTGPEHMVQCIEEKLQQGPAGSYLEGFGAGRFVGYNLDYTGGRDTDADKDAIRQAATQQEVDKAKSRLQKKRAVAKILNINSKDAIYTRKTGVFKQQFDELFPPTPK